MADMTRCHDADDALIQRALGEARQTKALLLGDGVIRKVAELFAQQFAGASALLVADENTMSAAVHQVAGALGGCGLLRAEPFVFTARGLYAEHRHAMRLEEALRDHDGIPIAVGAGTINDLTKLVAHRLGRPYMAVATAASMDGYTACGASITRDELKQTFECPAPQAVLADTEVIAAAPKGLNASGYADLAAKLTAGADWLIAEALGVEPVDNLAWGLVQDRLRSWLDDPSGVDLGEKAATRRLTIGL